MKRINIVWCDDSIDTIWDNNVSDLFAIHNCHLLKKTKTSQELKKILEDPKVYVDAVIVDFNVGESDQIPASDSASGFRWVHEHLDSYRQIPFYLYSARDYDFIRNKYSSFEFNIDDDYFFNPNKNVESHRNRYFQPLELEELAKMIEEEVGEISTPEFKIRNEFSQAFDTLEEFELDKVVFMQILLSDESVDRYEICNKANPLRMVLEKMVSKLQENGILPAKKLNELPSLLRGTDNDSNRFSPEDYMHKSLFKAFKFLLEYTQDGSHDKETDLEFKEYLKSSRDNYIVKSLAIIALDVIRWMGQFYEKYKDLKPFAFEPFTAKAIDIIKVKGTEGAIVKDSEGKTYFVPQSPNPRYRYSKGSTIKIISRRTTSPEFGDYFAFGRNLDVD